MATRIRIPGERDEFGYYPYKVTGNSTSESYTTKGGDKLVDMLGGDDTVNVTASYNRGTSELEVHGGPGKDTIHDLNDISGETLYGDDGDDLIFASSGDDWTTAIGGNGNDQLVSRGGALIYLSGGAGADALSGHESSYDWFNGGAGKDEFWLQDDDAHPLSDNEDRLVFFSNHTGLAGASDVAFGFDPEDDDKIDLGGIDANKGRTGDQDFRYIGEIAGPGVEVKAQQVAWFNDGGHIRVKWDDGQGDEAVLLDNLAGVSLGKEDFIL